MKQGKKNAYICPNLHIIVTVDRDEGVTPMFLMCPECQEQGTSKMYMINQTLEPTYEWYKPNEHEIQNEITELNKSVPGMDRKDIAAGIREHVSKGGLLFRKIKPQ